MKLNLRGEFILLIKTMLVSFIFFWSSLAFGQSSISVTVDGTTYNCGSNNSTSVVRYCECQEYWYTGDRYYDPAIMKFDLATGRSSVDQYLPGLRRQFTSETDCQERISSHGLCAALNR